MGDEQRRADVKVGILVLGALVIFIAGSLWIAGSAVLEPPRVDYRVLLRDSGGIRGGDRVRIAGVSVGQVQGVDLRPQDEWPVIFRIAVRRSISIHADATARVLTSGLVGNAYLQLEPGTAAAPRLAAGDEIRGAETGAGLESAMAQAAALGARAERLLDQVSTTLDRLSAELEPLLRNASALLSEENAERVASLLDAANATMEQSGPRLATLLERLDAVAASAEGGMERMPELGQRLDGLLADLRTALGEDGARLATLLETANGSLGSADAALAVLADNRRELDAAIRDLGQTAANLRSFSQTIKERPYSLVRVKPEPERRPGEDRR